MSAETPCRDQERELLKKVVNKGDAVEAGRIIRLHPFLAQGMEGACPALHRVTQLGDAKMVVSLLSSGATSDERDCKKNTTLHLACSQGLTGIAHILVNRIVKEIRGMSISSKNGQGMTPLMLVAEKGNYHIMELRCSSNAKQDARDEGGRT